MNDSSVFGNKRENIQPSVERDDGWRRVTFTPQARRLIERNIKDPLDREIWQRFCKRHRLAGHAPQPIVQIAHKTLSRLVANHLSAISKEPSDDALADLLNELGYAQAVLKAVVAALVEQADTEGLNPSAQGRDGSSPSGGTKAVPQTVVGSSAPASNTEESK